MRETEVHLFLQAAGRNRATAFAVSLIEALVVLCAELACWVLWAV